MRNNYIVILLVVLMLCPSVTVCGKQDQLKVLFPGNWADPTIVKVVEDYYLTSNNDNHVPSVLVFRSRDLRRWKTIGYASPEEGQGPATDIALYENKLYIYGGGGRNPWVMFSETPYTSWFERINMQPVVPHGIDAGHISNGEGNRYLFTNQGKIVHISKDGLIDLTAPEKVYEAWEIPDNIAIECVCLESPKLFERDGWFYMVSAEGGTAGPATSHMAVVARAKNLLGPWEDSPHNPLIWTKDASEPWWSKGHATLIEGPDRNWYAIYHGYMNGQRSFGRCTLISPVEWKTDGWPVLSSNWPEGWDESVVIELPLSDEFSGYKLGLQWQSLGKLELQRYSFENGRLMVEAMGEEPGASFPLTLNPRHPGYEVETELVIEGDVTAGLILFYSPKAFVSFGLSHDGHLLKHVKRSETGPFVHPRDRIAFSGKHIKLRMKNDSQDASAYYLDPDGKWIKLEQSEDISGFQHNIFGGFLSVRPGIFAVGNGNASFNYFHYRGLE